MNKPATARLPIYKNRAMSAAMRIKDLLSRMTLEEKATQMMCVWQKKSETLLDAEGNFDLRKARAAFKHGHGLGQVGRPSDAGKGKNAREMAVLTNAIQKFFIENSQLGIPVMFHEERLHGHSRLVRQRKTGRRHPRCRRSYLGEFREVNRLDHSRGAAVDSII